MVRGRAATEQMLRVALVTQCCTGIVRVCMTDSTTFESSASEASCDLTVYYDGGCPLCRREIATYQSMNGAERLNWQDVSRADEQIAPDLLRSDALARMHVRTADGKLVHGAGAFALMWQAFPKTRWLGRLAATPPALLVLEPVYGGFLKIRPLWRRKCDLPAP